MTPLAGRTIATTRATPGRLDTLLAAAGAAVVHVPLIVIEPPHDDGADLAAALATLGDGDWLVVTSQHGALAAGAAVRTRPGVRLAAVGTRTAEVLAERCGRRPEVVPPTQTAAGMLEVFPPADPIGTRLVAALGDLAGPGLAAGLTELGYAVRVATAYRTIGRRPDPDEIAALTGADAVVFASGSQATAWAAAMGPVTPAVVIAIGPTTAAAAEAAGIGVTAMADDHSVDGLVATTIATLT